MPSSHDRKRIEIPGTLHAELSRQARSIGMAPTALATYLLSQALQAAEARGQVPWHARDRATPQAMICDHVWQELDGGRRIVCAKCATVLHRAE